MKVYQDSLLGHALFASVYHGRVAALGKALMLFRKGIQNGFVEGHRRRGHDTK